jgi:CopG family nickel-responsive transcriptional regulator
MNTLIRFGVSMEKKLLERFDRMIKTMGYTTRSEAIRDIVRDRLVEQAVQGGNAEIFGVLTLVYDHHKRELEDRLTDFQHHHFKNIITTSHVHIDHHNCLEVVILRGKARILKNIMEHLLSIKGVKHAKLVLTSTLNEP